MCSYILPVVFHYALYFGEARCMRTGRPNASFGGGKLAPTIETSGAPTGAMTSPPPEVGDSVERCVSGWWRSGRAVV